MKTTITMLKILPVLMLALLVGCSLEAPSDPSAQTNAPGLEDAGARYVSIGNSLTAGFMDGGLMQAGQAGSFPRLIATQLGLDNDAFSQPRIATPGLGTSSPSTPTNAAGVLYFDGTSISILGETPLADVESTLLLDATQPTPYHNLGVPGATVHDGQSAFDAASSQDAIPFFDFINRASFFGNVAVPSSYRDGAGGVVPVTYQSASMFFQAIAKGPALVTCWLGNNDVLGPATGGDPPAGFGPATAATFEADYTALLAMLADGLAQRVGFQPTIVVANIPDITSIPYFIPEAVFDAFVDNQIGAGWPGGYEESSVAYVLFPTLSWILTNDTDTAIPSDHTLTAAEATDVATAVGTYNQIIAGAAAQVNASGTAKMGLVDANSILANLDASRSTHFLFLLPQFGGDVAQAAATTYFSLDGIHPNNVGYGMVANSFIDVINSLDGTSIPQVDLGTLAWDPTYGVSPTPPTRTAVWVDAKAAAAMASIFR